VPGCALMVPPLTRLTDRPVSIAPQLLGPGFLEWGRVSHRRRANVPLLLLITRLLKADAALTCNTCLFKRIHVAVSQRELVTCLR
jgi:hypothetical protein